MAFGGSDILKPIVQSAVSRSPIASAILRSRLLPSQCQIIYAVIPIFGYGTFQGSSNYGAFNFNDTWPNVYQTMTETWIDGVGSETQTTVWNTTVDQLTTVTGSGSSGRGYISSTGTPSITSTVFTCTYAGTYAGNPFSGTYTATLSSQFSISSSWASYTSQANSLLTHATLASNQAGLPVYGSGGITNTAIWYTSIYPTVASPGYQVNSNAANINSVAMNGFPLKALDYYPADWGNWIEPIPSIMTGGPYSTSTPNKGGCCCLKSAWYFRGQMNQPYNGIINPSQGYFEPIAIHRQSITVGSTSFSGGTPAIWSGLSPNPFLADTFATFTPANCPSPYGILDFPPTAV